jgi:hypothetical protein
MDNEDTVAQTQRILFDWVKALESRIRELGESDSWIEALRCKRLEFSEVDVALERAVGRGCI